MGHALVALESMPHCFATLPSFEPLFAWLALSLIGLSGVLLVCEAVGLLPSFVSDWINRNRLAQTLSTLRGFGIDVDTIRKRNRAASLDQRSAATFEERVRQALGKVKLEGAFTVGQTYGQDTAVFHDLMGATASLVGARLLARDLVAKWREVLTQPGSAAEDQFGFIATPKGGSPLLGAAFAELMNVPLALHTVQLKFESVDHPFQARFDCPILPERGTRALVVDDSSTGGGKIIRLATDLRNLGYEVDDVLVVFEPQLKLEAQQNAAQRMAPLGLRG